MEAKNTGQTEATCPTAFVFKGAGIQLSLSRILASRGWVAWEEGKHGAQQWNLCWNRQNKYTKDYMQRAHSDKKYTPLPHKMRRINHFRHTLCLTTKDGLARTFRRLQSKHGAVFDFHPLTFVLPSEQVRMETFLKQQRTRAPPLTVATATAGKETKKEALWICKPTRASKGDGIFLVPQSKLSTLKPVQAYVVQQYIPNPLLIRGFKFDLRLYVVVTRVAPLRVFLFKNGLVRFSTSKYAEASTENLFAHLTNTSVNKKSPTIDQDKDGLGSGQLWELTQFMDQLESFVDPESAVTPDKTELWTRIQQLVMLTMLPLVESSQAFPKHAFELFGFDVLIDQQLKPHLIEVNLSPSIAITGPVETTVIGGLLHGMLDLLGFTQERMQQQEADPQQRQRNRSKFDLVFPFNERVTKLASGWDIPNKLAAERLVKVSAECVVAAAPHLYPRKRVMTARGKRAIATPRRPASLTSQTVP